MKQKNEEILSIQRECLMKVGLRKNVEAELEKALIKFKDVEEGRYRHEAWRTMEENKTTAWEIERKKLVEMI